MKDNQYDRFKRLLIQYLREHDGACDPFIQEVKKTKTPDALQKLVYRRADEIAEHIGAEPDYDDCPHCAKKDREIEKLEDKMDEMMVDASGETLEDYFKRKAIGEYYDKYSSQELEDLLKHGKELLKSLTV